MRPLDDTASTKMYRVVYISVLDWKRDGRHEIAHHWYRFPCLTESVMIGTKMYAILYISVLN